MNARNELIKNLNKNRIRYRLEKENYERTRDLKWWYDMHESEELIKAAERILATHLFN